MKRVARTGSLALVLGLGILILVLMLSSFSTATASGWVDLMVEMEAPTHVVPGSTYLVRIAYYNLGTEIAPDAQVTATLPEEAQFVAATDRWGEPLPPDTVAGNTLSWNFERPNCYKPLNACCGHILLLLHVDEGLPDGTMLPTTASVATTAVDSDPSNNESMVVSFIGVMAGSTKQVQAGRAMPGDELIYTITISRVQESDGTEWDWVTLTDRIPLGPQVRFLGWTSPVTATIDGDHILSWEGKINGGKFIQLQYRLGLESGIAAGTVITNGAMLGWGEQFMQLGPVTTAITLPYGALALAANEPGEIHHRYGLTLTIPPGAITETTRFQIGPLFTDTMPNPPGSLLFANRAFEANAFSFGTQIGQFNRPLTITMNYTEADVHGLIRETVRLWARSGPDGPWALWDEPVRMMSGTLTFTTTHFTEFALFGRGEHQAFLPVLSR